MRVCLGDLPRLGVREERRDGDLDVSDPTRGHSQGLQGRNQRGHALWKRERSTR